MAISKSMISKAISAALAYRQDEQKPGGVVLVWAGQVYGWKNELRDPQHERPGALAVDAQGQVWRAIGGDDYRGASGWEKVALPGDFADSCGFFDPVGAGR